MGLQRVEALEIEQRIDEARGRGIAVVDRDQVGAERVAEIGFVAQRLVIGLADQIARQRRMVEPLGDPMHHRIFQPLVMQHGRIDEGGQFGLAANDVLRLAADAIPDRIERGQLRTLRIDLMHCHGCSRKFACLVGIIARRAGCLSRAGARQSKPPPNAVRGLVQGGQQFQEIKPDRRPTIGEFRPAGHSRHGGPNWGEATSTRRFCGRGPLPMRGRPGSRPSPSP